MCKLNASFQLKRSKVKVKVTGRRKSQETEVMFTYRRQIERSRLRLRLQTAYPIARPNLLSLPEHEMLDNWTDGRISCRHSVASCFLVYVEVCNSGFI